MPRQRRCARHDLSWISLASTALVAAYLVVLHQIEPLAWARAQLHTRFVLAVGYGHLLASAVGARKPLDAGAPRRAGPWVLGLLLAYAIYTQACRLWPALPLVLLGVSAWHTFENDRALRRTRLDRPGGIEPISSAWRDHGVDVGCALAASAAVVALPDVLPEVDQTDVIVAFTLQHLVAWLVFTLARGHARRRLRATLLRLAWLHAPMIAVSAVAATLAVRPDSASVAPARLAALVLEPSTYLFWSTAHVVHTAWRRRPDALR